MTKVSKSFAIVFLIIFSSSCSYLKAKPAADSGFLSNIELIKDDSDNLSPVQRGWASDYWKQNSFRYKNIIVAAVNTDYLVKADWWQQQNSKTKAQLEIDRKEIATYMQKTITEAYQNDPNKRLQVVNDPRGNTLILELALVELIPAKVFFNAAASTAGIFVPGVSYLTAGGKGSIAIEGRVRDAETGQVLAKFADRESDKSAPINIAQYSWYQGSKQNIDDWAEQLVELINTPEGQKVADSSPFTLKPW